MLLCVKWHTALMGVGKCSYAQNIKGNIDHEIKKQCRRVGLCFTQERKRVHVLHWLNTVAIEIVHEYNKMLIFFEEITTRKICIF